jgi:hypothetical protein
LLCRWEPFALSEVPPAREDRALVLSLLDRRGVDAREPQQQPREQEQRDCERQLGRASETPCVRIAADRRSISVTDDPVGVDPE